jgi:hypothetical protein
MAVHNLVQNIDFFGDSIIKNNNIDPVFNRGMVFGEMSLNVQMFQGPQVLERRRPVTGGSGS